MKKVVGILVCIIMLFGITACNGVNEAPVITGVKSEVSVALGEDFNALNGVTASDKEDGDLTKSIVVTSVPEMAFTNGVAKPTARGDYELTYEVKDSKGLVSEKQYSTLTVTRPVGKEELFKTYTFADTAEGDISTYGLGVEVNGTGAATLEKKDGHLVMNVTNLGAGDTDVMLNVREFAVTAGIDYELRFYMKSSAPFKFHFLANNTMAGWEPLGTSAWNVDAGTDLKPYIIKFTAPKDAVKVEILMQMGKIAFDGYVSPQNFTLEIEKFEIYASEGTESSVSQFVTDYVTNDDGFQLFPSDATLTKERKDGTQVVTVKGQNATESWGKKIVQPTEVDIVKDKKYKVEVVVTAQNAQFYEMCFEQLPLDNGVRAEFISGTINAAEKKTISYTFIAKMDVEDMVIRFDCGKVTTGLTENLLTFEKFEVFEIRGDKTVAKTAQRFIPFNKSTEWDTFNGTDADLEKGIGTMYHSAGSLFYKINELSSVDYGNKIFVNGLKMDEDALYRLEFKAKASQNSKAWFILNPVGDYAPKINQVLEFTTDEKTFSITTTKELVVAMNMEMVFSFGAPYNTDMDGLLVQFSEFKVYKIS